MKVHEIMFAAVVLSVPGPTATAADTPIDVNDTGSVGLSPSTDMSLANSSAVPSSKKDKSDIARDSATEDSEKDEDPGEGSYDIQDCPPEKQREGEDDRKLDDCAPVDLE